MRHRYSIDGMQEILPSHDRHYATLPALIVAGFAIIYATFLLARFFDATILSPGEILWNILVYLTPTRLIIVLARWKGSQETEVKMRSGGTSSERHAMKGEALRTLLALNSPLSKSSSDAGTFGTTRLLQRSSPTSNAPPGLGNWDNSCYQNSVLQGLSSLQSLSAFLNASNNSTARDSSTTTGSLREITTILNDSGNNGKRIWTPSKLKSMSSWQQQDAQEYFSKILDDLDKELIKAATGSTKKVDGLGVLAQLERALNKQVRSLPEQDVQPTVAAQPLDDSAERRSDEGPLSVTKRNPVEGLLAQRVACTSCGFSEGLSLLPFNCLTVPLGRRQQYNIEECLDEYTALEEISGVECSSCTLKRTEAKLAKMVEPTDTGASEPTTTITLPPNLRVQIEERLQNVREALEDSDFSDNTLYKKCLISKDARVSSTKTRQAVVARAPKALVIHINRSVFDEYTGAQRKNHADVRYTQTLNFGRWCLGKSRQKDGMETWTMNASESMIPGRIGKVTVDGPSYLLRAVVTHYGRHENGHYICYRKHPLVPQDDEIDEGGTPQWWRLSDEDVSAVTEDDVLQQGGAFMLFYELINTPNPSQELPVSQDKAVDAPLSETSDAIATPVVAEEAVSEYHHTLDVQEMEQSQQHHPEIQHFERVEEVLTPPAVQTTSRKLSSPSVMRTSRSSSNQKQSKLFQVPPPLIA